MALQKQNDVLLFFMKYKALRLTWKNWYAMTQSSITGLSIPLDKP